MKDLDLDFAENLGFMIGRDPNLTPQKIGKVLDVAAYPINIGVDDPHDPIVEQQKEERK